MHCADKHLSFSLARNSTKAACTSSSGGAGRLEVLALALGLGVRRDGAADDVVEHRGPGGFEPLVINALLGVETAGPSAEPLGVFTGPLGALVYSLGAPGPLGIRLGWGA